MFHQARNPRNQRGSFPGYIGLHLWLEAPTWGQHFFWERAVHRLRKKLSPIAINPVFTTTPCHCHHHSCVDGSHCQEVLINTVIKLFWSLFIISKTTPIVSDDEDGSEDGDADVDCRLVEGGVRAFYQIPACTVVLISDPSLGTGSTRHGHLLLLSDHHLTQLSSLNGHLLLLSLYRMIAQILEDLSQICHWHSSRSQDLWLEYEI